MAYLALAYFYNIKKYISGYRFCEDEDYSSRQLDYLRNSIFFIKNFDFGDKDGFLVNTFIYEFLRKSSDEEEEDSSPRRVDEQIL